MCMEIQQITDQNKPEENSFRSGILHVLELVLLAFHVPHLRLLLHWQHLQPSPLLNGHHQGLSCVVCSIQGLMVHILCGSAE